MSSKGSELITRRERVVARGVARFAGTATAVSANGAAIIDADGRELIDFAGGIGVMNVGYSDPAVVKAVQDQASRLMHACIHVATYEPYVALCEKLAQLLPHGEQTKVMLINSGAEAVENAIKIARQHTGRRSVICFTESFHGRTLLCSSLTSKTSYKINCGPFAPEIYRLPYPSRYRYGLVDGVGRVDSPRLDENAFAERELQRLRHAFVNTVRPDDVAAIIIELVQGEGGFVVAPQRYVEGLRDLCDEHGIVLIFDEVQSGFGRTGKWGSFEHFGITPDLSTWAKSMGGGLPISAVMGRAEVMDAALPGTLGGTYGGNPVACAAALAAIGRIEELHLNDRATEIGRIIRDRFESLRSVCPLIADVRGLGAMQAVEFVLDGDPDAPATAFVRGVLDRCLERGLLSISAGAHGNIIRVLCPLVITDAQLERGLAILEEEIRTGVEAPDSAPAAAAR